MLPLSDLIFKCEKDYDGTMQEWFDLEPRDAKYKDKYVGGSILLGTGIDRDLIIKGVEFLRKKRKHLEKVIKKFKRPCNGCKLIIGHCLMCYCDLV